MMDFQNMKQRSSKWYIVLDGFLAVLGTSANRSANCRLKVLVCGFANRFLTANICGKKIEIYRKSANQQHHWNRFCNFQKNTFLQFNASTDLGGCISNVQHLSPRSSAVERLFSRGAAILTAKWVGLRSRNFQRFVFVKENLDFLKWQRVAQDDFDDMPSTFVDKYAAGLPEFSILVLSF